MVQSGMTGAFLNAIGILIGALFGLALPRPLSVRAQAFYRTALGTATVFFGLRLVWLSVNGTFFSAVKQLLLAALAVVLGCWLGKLLRLQRISNRVGRYAGNIITATRPKPNRKGTDSFIACAILFCAAPLGWLGAVTDGLSGYFFLLAIKAVMDGLAMAGLMKNFGWLPAMSAFPVFALLGLVTFVSRTYALPLLEPRGLLDPVNAAAGLITCAVALVIFDIRKVELANYLPALALAPLLAALFR
jgi:uncharacterized membrane protein YqgA involved in biofilm formation